MALCIRPGDLESDQDAIVTLLSRHLNPAYDHRRFDWLYRHSPGGPGRAWVAVEASTGDVVGTAGASPRAAYVAGSEALAWVFTDFCIVPQFRVLGPAMALQRACLAAAALENVAFCYDFPGAGMIPVYRRLGIGSALSMRRAVKMLRAGRKLRATIGSPVLAAPVVAAANLVLHGIDSWSRRGRAATLDPVEGRCGDEFTTLAERMKGTWPVWLRRSAEYLNWRYLDVPFRDYQVLATREAGTLTGYCVLAQEGDHAVVVDLLCGPTDADFQTLVQGIASFARARGLAAVALFGLDSHPWVRLLPGLGFSLRESAPVIVHAVASPAATTSDAAGWFLAQGDRDS